jgi:hypothetical protein
MSQETLYPVDEPEVVDEDGPILSFGKHRGKTLRYLYFYHRTYLSMLRFWCQNPPAWAKNTNLLDCLPWLKEWKVDAWQGNVWLGILQMD